MSISMNNHETRIKALENKGSGGRLISYQGSTNNSGTRFTLPTSDFTCGVITFKSVTLGGGDLPLAFTIQKGLKSSINAHLSSAQDNTYYTYDGNVTISSNRYNINAKGWVLFKLYYNLKSLFREVIL